MRGCALVVSGAVENTRHPSCGRLMATGVRISPSPGVVEFKMDLSWSNRYVIKIQTVKIVSGLYRNTGGIRSHARTGDDPISRS
jgi:hypothetical protein